MADPGGHADNNAARLKGPVAKVYSQLTPLEWLWCIPKISLLDVFGDLAVGPRQTRGIEEGDILSNGHFRVAEAFHG